MRYHLDILNDIYIQLEKANLLFELTSLRNVADHQYTSSEFLGEVGSCLLAINQEQSVFRTVGVLINEFIDYCHFYGIYPRPATLNSIEKKGFEIDGNDFKDLKEFFNSLGKQLVEKNKWGKNWNAFNDILRGGFVKTEYEEPFRLTWKNSHVSRNRLEDFNDIVDLIGSHKHIELVLQ